MKLLIDTHIAIWALADDPRLSDSARLLIADETNTIFVSAAFLTHDSLICDYEEPCVLSV